MLMNSNLNFGIEQVLLFPEIESHHEFFEFLRGCHVHITTSPKAIVSSKLLLTAFKVVVPAYN